MIANYYADAAAKIRRWALSSFIARALPFKANATARIKLHYLVSNPKRIYFVSYFGTSFQRARLK